MNLLGFGTRPVDVSFTLKDDAKRRRKKVKMGDVVKEMPVYYDREDVTGQVHIKMKKPGTRLDHQGIRIEFIGQIEPHNEKSTVHEFVALSKLLAYPSDIDADTTMEFSFIDAEKPYESYYGTNVKLRYFLKLTIIKRFANIVVEEDLFVQNYATTGDQQSSKINMEVGIEESLHIEFEYTKSSYHLSDVIVGKIYFSLVRIKIKYMEVNLTRKEIVGHIGSGFAESETVARYEILDGAPSKGETIPIRLFLAPYDLTPTMRDVLNKFSVHYSINLVLVDEEDRRYFKQQDITLWRKGESEFLQAKEHLHAVPRAPQVALNASTTNGSGENGEKERTEKSREGEEKGEVKEEEERR